MTASMLDAALFASVAPCPVNAAPSLEVRVYNHAGVSDGEVTRMTSVAASVLRRAGIGMISVVCSPLPDEGVGPAECGTALGPSDMLLEILAAPTAPVGRRALGLTRPSERSPMMSEVYYSVAIHLAAQPDAVQAPELLGYALAHEIGHALLGAHAHSASGIMAARFSRPQLEDMARGCLYFSSRQAGRLKQGLRARVTSQVACLH